jgi:hypothetical protein
LSGSFTSIESTSSGSLRLDVSKYVAISRVLGSIVAGTEYSRVSDLDTIELFTLGRIVQRLGESTGNAYGGVGIGLRQEYLGSFNQARYPIILELGFKGLASPAIAFNAAYVYRRLLNDPVSDISEHRIEFGFSLLINNKEE